MTKLNYRGKIIVFIHIRSCKIFFKTSANQKTGVFENIKNNVCQLT